MASLVVSSVQLQPPAAEAADDRQGWGFATLLLAVAVLFLRPADLLLAFEDWPFYQVLIVLCLGFAVRPVWRQLAHRELSEQPVTACLLVLIGAVTLSHLAHGFIWAARMSAWMVIKVVLLYLLVTGLASTPRRLLVLVRWLTLAITLMASLALLDEAGWLSIPSLESIRDRGATGDGEVAEVMRLRGTGIFQDPNDLGLVVVPGIVLSLFLFGKPRLGWIRYGWLVPTGVLLTALAQTHSRGAFVALLVTIPAFVYSRWGFRAACWASLAGAPLTAAVFAGRMTEWTSIQQGTGQSRLQIWSDNLYIFRQQPLFGIGEGMLVEEFGVVSHNSFLHCFAELGVLGGASFLGAFLVAIFGLAVRGESGRRGSCSSDPADAEIERLRPFMLTALVAYSAGLMSLSRQFVAPTYLMLGLAVATQRLAGRPWPPGWRNGLLFAFRVGLASGLFLVAVHAAVLSFVQR